MEKTRREKSGVSAGLSRSATGSRGATASGDGESSSSASNGRPSPAAGGRGERGPVPERDGVQESSGVGGRRILLERLKWQALAGGGREPIERGGERRSASNGRPSPAAAGTLERGGDRGQTVGTKSDFF